MYRISIIATQCAFVMADVAKGEEVAPSDVALVHEELGDIVKPDVIVEDNDDD